MKGRTMEEIEVGDVAKFQKTISETDVYLYAGITGDINPAHINREAMKESKFKHRIAHGMLTAGLVSAVLGVQLPGPGTIYLGQELKFTAPVYFGDTITAIIEVKSKDEKKNILELLTTCVNQEGNKVLVGKATVMPPKH